MKPIKELLEILLDRYENNSIYMIQWAGLCWAISRLYDDGVISEIEDSILTSYLYSNKPEWAWSGYWWTEGKVEPRVKFLKQLITKYETQCQSK